MSSKQAELRRLMKLQREKKQQAPPPPKKAPKSILKKATQQKKSTANGGLSALVAGYSSSSSSENEEPEPVQPPRARIAPVTFAEKPNVKKNPKVSFSKEEPAQNAIFKESIAQNAVAQKKQVVNGGAPDQKEEDVDHETWKQFEDLVGDNDDATPVAKNETQQSLMQQPPISQQPAAAPLDTAADAKVAAAKQPTEAEEATADAAPYTTQVEQVAYEARLARLRLKMAAAKKRKRVSSDKDVTSYTPDLAFQQQDNEAKVSHLEILRRKREKARKLLNMDEVDDQIE